MKEEKNIYVGNRYVPKIIGEWDRQEPYEGLSIVTNEGTSYTSKKGVPIGVDIHNESYWVVTGNYNAQIENYRQEVKKNSKDLSNYKDEVATQFQQINYQVEHFGAVGDGITDDTQAIQKALDSIPDNSTLSFENKIYKVSKNTNLPNFPNNDQPCLSIYNRKGLRLIGKGTVLKVDEHAQGILEFQKSKSCFTFGIELKGPGVFPKLDGKTGRGEKAVPNEGYYHDGFGFGNYKNNSVDSSRFVGVGKNTTNVWGSFQGGFIGNVSHGILVHNGCLDVKVEECIATGFNFSGFSVGFSGDFYPDNKGLEKSRRIKFVNCLAQDCYDNGFNHLDVEDVVFDDCESRRIGHPNYTLTDEQSDPGYGITSRQSSISPSKKIVLNNFKASNCVRKGIDSHSHVDMTINGGYIYECIRNGIGIVSNGTSFIIDGTIINDLVIENSGYRGSATDIASSIKGRHSNTSINNLTLKNCGGGLGLINLARVLGVKMKKITISGLNPLTSKNALLFKIDSSDEFVVDEINMEIEDVTTGYGAYIVDSKGLFLNSTIKNDNAALLRSLRSDVTYTNNTFDGLGKVQLDDNATEFNNTFKCGFEKYETKAVSMPIDYLERLKLTSKNVPVFTNRAIKVEVTFNGTASPTYTSTSELVSNVSTDDSGFRISFKGELDKTIPIATLLTKRSAFVGTSIFSRGYTNSSRVAYVGIVNSSGEFIDATTLSSGMVEVTFIF